MRHSIVSIAVLIAVVLVKPVFADTEQVRGNSTFLIGVEAGLDIAAGVPALKLGYYATDYLLIGGLYGQFDGKAEETSSSFTSSTKTTLEGPYTNVGLYGRFFPANSFNISFGVFSRNWDMEGAYSESSGGEATAEASLSATVARLAIGNHWIFDSGFSIGADWAIYNHLISSSRELDSIETSGGVTYAKAEDEFEDLLDFAEIVPFAKAGFVQLTIGYSF